MPVTIPVRTARRVIDGGGDTSTLVSEIEAQLRAHDRQRGYTPVKNVRLPGGGGRQTDATEQLRVVVNLLNHQLRRFPRTDCALTLSLKNYFGGNRGRYLR